MDTSDYHQEILQAKATLKIITKTKNERFFIEKWIRHHLAIIGDGKLIIFDNMSDDEYVLNIYKKYKDNIILIKFDTWHNDIHRYEKIKDFYDAVISSTDFLTVLDSDEFLYLYDNSTAIHDTTILDYLRDNKDCDFFAPCWLDNIEGEERVLNLNSEIHSIKEKADLIDLFDWGKAIVNSNILKKVEVAVEVEKQNVIVDFGHTIFLPALNYENAQTKFFIAHLKNLSVEQRISTNMNKLVSHKLLSSNTDFEGLFKLNDKSSPYNVLTSYIKQTQRLVRGLRANPAMPSKMPSNKIVEIDKDDKLYFPNKFSEQTFSHLANCNYLHLINYDYAEIKKLRCEQIFNWLAYTKGVRL